MSRAAISLQAVVVKSPTPDAQAGVIQDANRMKQWIYSMSKSNRHVERPLRLMLQTARSVRAHGIRHTGVLVAQRLRRKKQAFQNQRYLEKLQIPTGWPILQMPSLNERLQQRHWSRTEGYRPTFSLILPLSDHSHP